MKTGHILLVALTVTALSASVSFASVFTINISRVETNVVTSIGGNPRSTEDLSAILEKLASFNTNMQVNVRVDASAVAEDLIQVLYLIQKTGLHNVVLMAPGVLHGKPGYYQLSIDCTKRPIGGCIADFFVASGFHPSDEIDGQLEDITEDLEKLTKPETSQQPPERDK